MRLVHTTAMAALVLLTPPLAMGATALFDFRTGNVQPGWTEVSSSGSGTSGSISISTTAVGTSLDNRDRGTGNGGGAESEMWRDFLFANGSNALGEGLDLAITGLAPQTTYPVRVWSFDDSSNGGRGATWNGSLLVFPDSPDPAGLGDYVTRFHVTSDATGAATIAGRVYAENGQPHHVFINGLEIGDPLPAAPATPKFAVDVDSTTTGAIATMPGFASLDATSGNGTNVAIGATTFTVFSAGGSRLRTSGGLPLPNQLTADFAYDDGGGAAVGLTISDLPAGWYEAQVWSWDSSYPGTVGDQIVGITRFTAGSETIFTNNFTPSSTDPFSFVFNSKNLPDGFGIFTRENNDNDRARFNGLALTPIAAPREFKIDIDVADGSPQTEPGWASLPVTNNTGSVLTNGVEFEVFSADGSRERSGPNDLTRDFIFDDGSDQAVGLRVWDLPDGPWRARVWSWDNDFPTTVGDQIVGITQFNADPEIIFTNNFAPSGTDPFTFVFDSSQLANGFGIFVRENNSANRARFTALELTMLPEPSAMVLAALGLLGLGLGVRRRRRSA